MRGRDLVSVILLMNAKGADLVGVLRVEEDLIVFLEPSICRFKLDNIEPRQFPLEMFCHNSLRLAVSDDEIEGLSFG